MWDLERKQNISFGGSDPVNEFSSGGGLCSASQNHQDQIVTGMGGGHTFLLILDLAFILFIDKLTKNIVDC